MTIHQVFVPPPGKNPTPGQTIGQKVSEDQYWRNKALEARGQREYEEEVHNIDAIRNPQPPMEPPIKIGGSINLGNFDLQAQAKEAAAPADKIRSENNERMQKMEAENEKLKGELLANSIAGLQKELGGQILKLQADIAGNRGNAKSIGDQLKEVMDITAMLGYVKPGNEPKPTVVQNATDAAISLEMLRLQLEDKHTERSFAWQMEKDRRNFQLELKKLDQANKIAQADVSARQQQNEMLWKAPQVIGQVIAAGLKGGGISNRPAPIKAQPPRQGAPPPAPETQEDGSAIPTLTADAGEAGEVTCPECGQPVAIGPTATRAICANCDMKINVERRKV